MNSAKWRKLVSSDHFALCIFHSAFCTRLLLGPNLSGYRFPAKSGTVSEMFDASFLLRVLFSALLTASGLSWLRWGVRPEQFGGPPAPEPGEIPVADSTSVPETAVVVVPAEPIRWPMIAIFAMLCWVGTMLLSQIIEDVEPLWSTRQVATSAEKAADSSGEPSEPLSHTDAIWAGMMLGCVVFVGLGLLLFGSGSLKPDQVGIHTEDWPSQIAWGQQAFLASILPTFLLLLATAFLRRPETLHPFLQMLREAPEQVPLAMMFFTAAVVAPLSEELVFRVTLQGWLTDQWHARGAIVTTAVIFAFVHGWRDGIALLPLALMLGYLYHTRRSYLAVVTAHSLFNATNMTLALLGAMGSDGTSS